MEQVNRLKKARVQSNSDPSAAILKFIKDTRSYGDIVSDSDFSDTYVQEDVKDLQAGDSIVILADVTLRTQFWTVSEAEGHGLVVYTIRSLEIQDGLSDNNIDNGFRLVADRVGFDNVSNVQRASEVFPRQLTWKDLEHNEEFIKMLPERSDEIDAEQQDHCEPKRPERKRIEEEEDANPKRKFVVSAGKTYRYGTEASMKLKKKLDESVFVRRVMIPGRHEFILREEGTVFPPTGEYLNSLRIYAAQRAVCNDLSGAMSSVWEGAGVWRMVEAFRLFQEGNKHDFDAFITGEQWPVYDYTKLSLDSFLPTSEKMDYNDRPQLIRKIRGLELTLVLGGGIEWNQCTDPLVTRINSCDLMNSAGETLHFRINEAVSSFITTVRNPSLDTFQVRGAQPRISHDYDLNDITGVIAFFQKCLSTVQADDFENCKYFENTVKPMLRVSSQKRAQTSGVEAGTTEDEPKRKRDESPQGQVMQSSKMCINDALNHFNIRKKPCARGESCQFMHISDKKSTLAEASPEVILGHVRELPPLQGLRSALLRHLQGDASEDEDDSLEEGSNTP